MPSGTALSTLRDNLLISLDAYNANDLDVTVTGSSGNRARLALNQALQKIYSLAKGTAIVHKDASSTALASTASQDHILLSAITDIDDIVSIYDATNDLSLERLTFKDYRSLSADPASATGTPTHYARWGDRIYLHPRPDSAITYTTFYVKVISDLSAVSDTTSLDSKFDHWVLAEARVYWQLMVDPADTATLSAFQAQASEARESAMYDLNADYDLVDEVESHWDQVDTLQAPRFKSPAG